MRVINDDRQNKKKKNTLSYFGCLSAIIISPLIFLCILWSFLSFYLMDAEINGRSGNAIESNIKNLIVYVQRRQNDYYESHDRFANSLKELDSSQIEQDFVLQYYQLIIYGNKNAAYTYVVPYSEKIKFPFFFGGLPMKEDLKAFVSVQANNSLIICASSIPGIAQPLAPLIQDDRIICAPGTGWALPTLLALRSKISVYLSVFFVPLWFIKN